LFLARRYAQPRNAGRLLSFATAVAFASVALGSMALILALAILDGFDRELHDNATRLSAHIEIIGFGKRLLPDYPATLATLRSIENVRHAEAMLTSDAIARSATFMDGVQIRGVESDLRNEPQSGLRNEPQSGLRNEPQSGLQKKLIAGVFAFSASDAKEAVIGNKLARKLGLRVGQKLTIYAMRPALPESASASTTAPSSSSSSSSSNSLSSLTSLASPVSTLLSNTVVEQFRIVGIYETGMSQSDDLYVYVPLAAAQTAMISTEAGSTDSTTTRSQLASGFSVLLHDPTRTAATVKSIENALGYPYYVLTLDDIYGSMFSWIELQKKPVPIILGLISIVAAFNIIATLFMMVVQKTSSIGVLRSLGARTAVIVQVFLLQGLLIGVLGTLSGCALGGVLCWLQAQYKLVALNGAIYFLDAVPIAFAAWHYALVIGASLFFCGLAALVPALVGARIPILRALKFR
jgi:lipoprotein-releasing system permease protein